MIAATSEAGDTPGSLAGSLAGIKVLDLSTVGPGSRCSEWLADLGADVVKVGRFEGGTTPAWHAYGAGRGTRRIRLNLADSRARDAFLAMVGVSDVVIDSFRPGVADRLGIGYSACQESRPEVIYAALTGYGQTGPYRDRAGHDLNYLAVGGYLHAQGRRADGAPAIPGATIADSAGGGLQAAFAIAAALLAREKTGHGAFLDVAATDGVVALMSLHIDEYLATGFEPAPGNTLLLGKYACYDVYECADGRHVSVAAIEAKFFANLCDRLGLSDLAAAQYADDRQPELRAAFAQKFRARSLEDWVEALADHDTCVAPVLSIADVVSDAHLLARGAFGEVRDPHGEQRRQVATVFSGAADTREAVDAVPAEASHAVELLREAGLDAEAAAILIDEGVAA